MRRGAVTLSSRQDVHHSKSALLSGVTRWTNRSLIYRRCSNAAVTKSVSFIFHSLFEVNLIWTVLRLHISTHHSMRERFWFVLATRWSSLYWTYSLQVRCFALEFMLATRKVWQLDFCSRYVEISRHTWTLLSVLINTCKEREFRENGGFPEFYIPRVGSCSKWGTNQPK